MALLVGCVVFEKDSFEELVAFMFDVLAPVEELHHFLSEFSLDFCLLESNQHECLRQGIEILFTLKHIPTLFFMKHIRETSTTFISLIINIQQFLTQAINFLFQSH